MRTLVSVVTQEHCNWVHREDPKIGVASEASDGSWDGKVLQLVLVGYCTFQSVTFPFILWNLDDFANTSTRSFYSIENTFFMQRKHVSLLGSDLRLNNHLHFKNSGHISKHLARRQYFGLQEYKGVT